MERGWFASGTMSEDERRRADALRLGVPFVTLGRDDISLQSLILIPEPLSRTANIVAYRHGEEGIEVALLDLADLDKIDFLRATHRVQVRLTDRSSIKQALLLYQKHLKEKFVGMVQGGKEAAESLLKHALHSGAHYVHMEPAHAETAGMIVRYRIEGALREAMRLPEAASRHIVERLKQLAKLFPVSTTVQEGTFTFAHDGDEVAVAMTAVPTAFGEKITMRLSSTKSGVTGFSLSSLGLHGAALEAVHNALQKQKGAVVVAGMAESGKTTLLYTMLDHLTAAHRSVATVEDTVEFRLPRVHQTMTRPDLGLTMPAALRAILKQDPDVVMVADINDDTLPFVTSAAKRGICMLGGVEARSAADVLERVPEAKLVIMQKLLRRLGPTAGKRALTRAEGDLLEGKVRFAKVLAALKEEGIVHEHTAWKDIAVFTAQSNNNYKGLVGIQEVLVGTRANENSLTLLEDALFKAVQGLVSIEEVVEMAAE